MDILLIKLLLAHIIADFILQFNSWVRHKEQFTFRSPYLYLHVLLHGVILLFLLNDIQYFLLVILYMFSHGAIDLTKLLCQKANTKRSWFFIDQGLHLVSIILLWYFTRKPEINLDFLNDQQILLSALAVLFITFPSAIIIRIIIDKWNPQLSGFTASTEISNGSSLQNAGKYIGIIERLLVFTFACTNNWEAIGFLIAAKSIFRFGDLRDAHDLKLTEYVLIGTLLSFGIAIASALFIINL